MHRLFAVALIATSFHRHRGDRRRGQPPQAAPPTGSRDVERAVFHASGRPAVGGPNQCFTDEGYGRFSPCDGSRR